jgi:SNF2 family DNA or RNA helicase
MTLALRPYQWAMSDHIHAHKRCALYAGMGLGKSVSTLTAIDALSLVEDVYPALIIAPLRVARSTWPDEIAKWPHLNHLRVSCVLGSVKERVTALTVEADIFTINYDNLVWLSELVTQSGEEWPFKTIVADEMTRLKGFRLRQGSVRAKALAKHAHKSPRFIGLTGTPASNGLADLWGQVHFLDKGERLGRTFSAFSNRWFRVGYDGFKVEPLPTAQGEIESRIKDLCLSLNAKDHFALSEPIVNVIEVDIPTKARRLYDAMEREMFLELNGVEVEAFNAASKTIKCLQLANGAIYTGDTGDWEQVHDAKLDALESVIEEASGMPVLVAYHFKSDLVRLQKRFPQGRHLDANEKTIKDFNAGLIPVLFAHPASAGHGLSLQHGSNIIAFFGLWWDLEQHMQIIERIGPTRQAQSGYDRPVFVHYITAKDTVDQVVLDRIRTKRSVQELLLEAMKRTSHA